jgi:uncharacterized protein YdcH (DUF465 family)
MIELNDSEKDLIRAGSLINAIKAVRERTNASLLDSKLACDAFRDAMPKNWEALYQETQTKYNELSDKFYSLDDRTYDLEQENRQMKYTNEDLKVQTVSLAEKLNFAQMLLEKVLKVY